MRIVSLCPSLTELVYDLGRGDDLVGITKFCIHPAERVGAVEKVGGTKDPKVARIAELAPDWVLMNDEENRIEDAEALRAEGLRCHTSMPRSAEETAEMVRSIGAALERGEEAEAIALDIERRAERVRLASAGLAPVSWAYLIWREPWMAVNADTFVQGLLDLTGAVNVFAEREERYPSVELAELVEAAPDVVLLGTEPFPFAEKHVRELAEATGWPPERFRIVDGEYLSWHGSRTPDGIDYVAGVVAAVREGRGTSASRDG